jgi:hypothetical protein
LKIVDFDRSPSLITNQQSVFMATSPSGKARVCKTLIMGSNPIVASMKKSRKTCSFVLSFHGDAAHPRRAQGQGGKARVCKTLIMGLPL